MPRSHCIYNVFLVGIHGTKLLGSFTVKYEAVNAVNQYIKTNPLSSIEVKRMRDGQLDGGVDVIWEQMRS